MSKLQIIFFVCSIFLVKLNSGLPSHINSTDECNIEERKVPSSQCDVEPRIVNEIIPYNTDKSDDEVCCALSNIIEKDVKKACSEMKGFQCVENGSCFEPRSIIFDDQILKPVCNNENEVCCEETDIDEDINNTNTSPKPKLNDVEQFSTINFDFNETSTLQTRFLAPVKINCPPQKLLQGFQFEQRGKTEFGYNYHCIDTKVTIETTTVENEWTPWGHTDSNVNEGSVNFLDRQKIDCKENGFLTSFHVEIKVDDSSLRYVYECGKPSGYDAVSKSCDNRQTKKEISPRYTIAGLKNHNVKCEDNEALIYFRLLSPPSFGNQYNYTCCAL